MSLRFALAIVLGFVSVLAIPPAQARKLPAGLAGTYVGSGTIEDRLNPWFYKIDNISLTLTGQGKVTGSAVMFIYAVSDGIRYPASGPIIFTAKGRITAPVKLKTGHLIGYASVNFSTTDVEAYPYPFSFEGSFSVNAKSGKGTFKQDYSDQLGATEAVLKKK
jgi:hypothetical protein